MKKFLSVTLVLLLLLNLLPFRIFAKSDLESFKDKLEQIIIKVEQEVSDAYAKWRLEHPIKEAVPGAQEKTIHFIQSKSGQYQCKDYAKDMDYEDEFYKGKLTLVYKGFSGEEGLHVTTLFDYEGIVYLKDEYKNLSKDALVQLMEKAEKDQVEALKKYRREIPILRPIKVTHLDGSITYIDDSNKKECYSL